MNFINLNESVKTAIRIAQSIASEYQNPFYSAAHLFKSLLYREIGVSSFLDGLNKDRKYLEEWAEMRIDSCPKNRISSDILPDEKIPFVFEEADNVRLKLGLLEVNPICVLFALIKPNVAFSPDQLKSLPLRENELFDFYLDKKEIQNQIGSNIFQNEKGTQTKTHTHLFKHCIDKTAQVLSDKIHPVVCREKEMAMMMEILGRHGKPNVMIIGESGVGKTALLNGFVYKLAKNDVPSYLQGYEVYELETSTLIAGATYKGEIEDRMKNLLGELRQIDKAILFIDEIQVLFDPKQGNFGVVNILKSELSKGDLTIIAASTTEEYRKWIDSEYTFNRRFEVVKLQEPDILSSVQMINSVLPSYSQFHQLKISEDAILECAKLAKRYTKDRWLPDSAIDLMDRTMAKSKMQNEINDSDHFDFTIQIEDVAAMIAEKTGIPVGKIQVQEKERLLSMEQRLMKRVVGQERAIKAMVDALLESRSGLNKIGQPIGSFFFLGATGTGKTELAKSLAEALFDNENAMIRFDMSEFKEEHSAALLYGAPPGYVGYEEGGLLVNKIREQPYSVVLFDEIEKAHPSVYDIFLQIMDEGVLHDRLGKEGDFSNAIIIFTSNLGSEWISEQLSAGVLPTTSQIMDKMTAYFRPEFLARLSEFLPFSPIDETLLLPIFNIQLKSLEEALQKQEIELIMDDEIKKMLAAKNFTPKYGARQIAGTIRTHLRRPISRLIVSNKLLPGQQLIVGKDENNELTWSMN